jgi:hypothetical protein
MRTSEIAPGEVFTTLLSTIAPGFNGYLYVYCHFHPARGYAFISDVGARNLATGYLAEAVELHD